MNYFVIMFWLVFAHMIGDMVLQTSFIAQQKGKRFYLMFCHIISYLGAIGITLHIFNIFSWYGMLWIGIGHLAMDSWKSRQPKDDKHFWCIYVDQGWHFLQLLILVIVMVYK